MFTKVEISGTLNPKIFFFLLIKTKKKKKNKPGRRYTDIWMGRDDCSVSQEAGRRGGEWEEAAVVHFAAANICQVSAGTWPR